MKLRGVLILLLLAIRHLGYSQDNNPIKLANVVPPSPEVGAFAKYGTYPVGYFTGKPDISVPIYEIKTGKLSLPISLSYDATGIRVDDVSSYVGQNWSLNANYMISRTVLDKPDDAWNGYLGTLPPRAVDVVNNDYYMSYFRNTVDKQGNAYDLEPDRFNFMIGNVSGKFVFDRSKQVMQIPETSVKINFDASNNTFRIVDKDGTIYIFDVKEMAWVSSLVASGSYSGDQFISAWHIGKIISADRSDSIVFTYENDVSAAKSKNFEETYGYAGSGQPSPNVHQWNGSGIIRTFYSKRLKEISFPLGKLEFINTGGRLDDYGKRLDRIIVWNNKNGTYNKVKSFQFIQGYYNCYATATDRVSTYITDQFNQYRLRLDTLMLKDANDAPIGNYQLYYNARQLPVKASNAQDFWGYTNGGSANNTLIPATIERSTGESIGGAVRSADTALMKAGILEKIVYPTGGYTVFDLESHQYMSSATTLVPEQQYATAYGKELPGSVRKMVTTFTLPLANETNGAFDLVISINRWDYSGPFPIYSNPQEQANAGSDPYVSIKNLRTGVINTYKTVNSSTDRYETIYNYPFIPGDPYELTAACYINTHGPTASIFVKYQRKSNIPQFTAEGGLRIKGMKSFDKDNRVVNKESYVYGNSDDGIGKFVGVPAHTFYYARDQRFYGVFAGSQCGHINAGKSVYQSNSIFDHTLLAGSPVVYPKITRYYGTVNTNAGRSVYYYDSTVMNAPSMPVQMAQVTKSGIFIIDQSWKVGNIIRQEDYRKNTDDSYTLIRSEEKQFNIVNTDTTFGMNANTKFDRVNTNGCVTYYFDDYAWGEYPILTGYVQLAQSKNTEVLPDNSNILSNTTTYQYDNTYPDFVTKTSTTNSEKQAEELTQRYPFNKSQIIAGGALTTTESAALDSMVKRNMISPIIEEIRTTAGVQTARFRTIQNFTDASYKIIAPSHIQAQTGSSPMEQRIVFHGYDDRGNLVEQSKKDDVHEVYLWGYNRQYPVAKVTGSDYNTIKSLINQGILDNLSSTDQQIRDEINKIRTNLNGSALVTTYTYSPLLGITSQTDPKGQTSFFEYDGFGRLKLIKDLNGKILKQYDYQYQKPLTQ